MQGWATGVHTLTGLPNGNALVPIGTPKTGRFPPDGVRAPPLLPGAPLVDSRTHAGAITVPLAVRDSTGQLVPDASGDQCTVQPNVDYDHGTVWITTQAANPGECCSQCSANGDSRFIADRSLLAFLLSRALLPAATVCWCASFWQGTCM